MTRQNCPTRRQREALKLIRRWHNSLQAEAAQYAEGIERRTLTSLVVRGWAVCEDDRYSLTQEGSVVTGSEL